MNSQNTQTTLIKCTTDLVDYMINPNGDFYIIPEVLICCSPLITTFFLVFVSSKSFDTIRSIVMLNAISTCLWSQYLLVQAIHFGFMDEFKVYLWLEEVNSSFHITFSTAVDGISLFFILLTTLVFPFCFLSIYKKTENLKFYSCCLLFLESFLLSAFCVNDLFFFYVFFEAVLIPMFFIIGIWGSGYERIKAAYYFFFLL